MKLVKENRGDALQRGMLQHMTREQARGHHLYAGVIRDPGIEAGAVAHGPADAFTERCGHATGRRSGRNPARLEHQDPAAPHPALGREHEGNPRCLARPRWGDQNCGTVTVQGRDQLRQHAVDWKRVAEAHLDSLADAEMGRPFPQSIVR